jgi:hypothetical protein
MSDKRVVPVEPTDAMVMAGGLVLANFKPSAFGLLQAKDIYKAMIAAAPPAVSLSDEQPIIRWVGMYGRHMADYALYKTKRQAKFYYEDVVKVEVRIVKKEKK